MTHYATTVCNFYESNIIVPKPLSYKRINYCYFSYLAIFRKKIFSKKIYISCGKKFVAFFPLDSI